MKSSLFEALTGHFLSGESIERNMSSEQLLIQSVIDHLTRLLNTRRGSIHHLPDYGLPDISGVYRNMPESVQELEYAMQETIEEYEPRLMKPIRIYKQQEEHADGFLLTFVVEAQLAGVGDVRLHTRFSHIGLAEIIPA
jgi:type VI secretion system protein